VSAAAPADPRSTCSPDERGRAFGIAQGCDASARRDTGKARPRLSIRAAAALLGIAAALQVGACCRTTPPPAQPGLLDRVADVAVPAAKSYLCATPTPPVLADSPVAVAVWAGLRAVLCQPAAEGLP
jgi:hypothetical protein